MATLGPGGTAATDVARTVSYRRARVNRPEGLIRPLFGARLEPLRETEQRLHHIRGSCGGGPPAEFVCSGPEFLWRAVAEWHVRLVHAGHIARLLLSNHGIVIDRQQRGGLVGYLKQTPTHGWIIDAQRHPAGFPGQRLYFPAVIAPVQDRELRDTEPSNLGTPRNGIDLSQTARGIRTK